MQKIIAERRTRLVEALRKLPGVRCAMPEGAFCAFCDGSAWIGRKAGGRVLESDTAIGQWLLEAAQVAVVPGGAFGAPGHLRLSYAVSVEQIDEALKRIARAVAT